MSAISSVSTLRTICIQTVERNPKSISLIPEAAAAVILPALRSLTVGQLAHLESLNPWLLDEDQPLWKAHVLHAFPNVGAEYDLSPSSDGEDEGEVTDWRATYRMLDDEHREKQRAAVERLRNKYQKIDAAKTEKRVRELDGADLAGIQRATKKRRTLPTAVLGIRRASHSTAAGAVAAPAKRNIMGKAIKAAMNTSLNFGGLRNASTSMHEQRSVQSPAPAPAPVRQQIAAPVRPTAQLPTIAVKAKNPLAAPSPSLAVRQRPPPAAAASRPAVDRPTSIALPKRTSSPGLAIAKSSAMVKPSAATKTVPSPPTTPPVHGKIDVRAETQAVAQTAGAKKHSVFAVRRR